MRAYLFVLAFCIVASSVDAQTCVSNICEKSVNTDEIASGAVGKGKLKANAVITEKIDDGAVTTAKLADKSVTLAKLADGVLTAGGVGPTGPPGPIGTFTISKDDESYPDSDECMYQEDPDDLTGDSHRNCVFATCPAGTQMMAGGCSCHGDDSGPAIDYDRRRRLSGSTYVDDPTDDLSFDDLPFSEAGMQTYVVQSRPIKRKDGTFAWLCECMEDGYVDTNFVRRKLKGSINFDGAFAESQIADAYALCMST